MLSVRQLPLRIGRPALRMAVYLATTLELAVMIGADEAPRREARFSTTM